LAGGFGCLECGRGGSQKKVCCCLKDSGASRLCSPVGPNAGRLGGLCHEVSGSEPPELLSTFSPTVTHYAVNFLAIALHCLSKKVIRHCLWLLEWVNLCGTCIISLWLNGLQALCSTPPCKWPTLGFCAIVLHWISVLDIQGSACTSQRCHKL